jgi:hypothetical protein
MDGWFLGSFVYRAFKDLAVSGVRPPAATEQPELLAR